MLQAQVTLEGAGFADAVGFGVMVWLAYFVLCGTLAIGAGVLISRVLFEPRPAR